MKKTILLAMALVASSLVADERIKCIYTVPGELNNIHGHVQGAACSTQGVYLSHAKGIFKIDWSGRLVGKCEAPYHLGDLGYYKGRIYGALALSKPIDGKRGMIRVWDENLNVVAEHLTELPMDGCVVLDDVIYCGRGPNRKEAHRGNKVVKFSLDFKELGEVNTDHGGMMHYGVQTMATEGSKIIGGYYNAGSPPVNCAWFTPDLRVCGGTPYLNCAQGFGMIPKELFPSEHPRFFTVNALGGGDRKWHAVTNPPQVRLDFYEFRNGKFFDVTERVPAKPIMADDFRIRDPFIYVDRGAKLYRLYEQFENPKKKELGVAMRTSKDLATWSLPKIVMTVPQKRKCRAVWAPEMHEYKGKYYIFATLTMNNDAHPSLPILESGDNSKRKYNPKRGTWIYRADSPEGPFKEWSNDSVTPPEWSALDGTLFVEDGKPYMVFCHEWTQVRDGKMMAMELTDDLKQAAGEPIELFRASSRPGAPKGANVTHVTDGPHFLRSYNGSLLMVWSSNFNGKYGVFVTKSESGKVAGPWGAHKVVFDGDGGHGMIFRTRHDQLLMCLHAPNSGRERMWLLPLNDLGDSIEIRK